MIPGPSSKKLSIEISKSIGNVSIKIVDAEKPKAVMTLAHGAGAGMEHLFMESLAEVLAKASITSIRFNFPYMENKKGRPDPAPVAEKTVEAVINKTYELYPKLPLFTSGKSFGGRMTSQRLSKECQTFVKGIIFFGFPLHPTGTPATDRANHLASITIPMLFLQGTRDTLAEMTLMEGVVKNLPSATLKKFEGADHSFKVSKRQLMEELATESSQWIDHQIKLSK